MPQCGWLRFRTFFAVVSLVAQRCVGAPKAESKARADLQNTARELGGDKRLPRASPPKQETKPDIDPNEAVAKNRVLVRLNATHQNWERNAILHKITLGKCKEDEYPALPT